MNKVYFATSNQQNHDLIEQIYSLRHQTFIKRLGWDITSDKGLEQDKFDFLDPVHIAVTDTKDIVKGCWRALPTTGDYMLKSVFPQLLQGEDAPQQEDIWEISRLAVQKYSSKPEHGYISNISLDLVRSFYDFAQLHNISSFVTVTTVACERMLRQLNVTLRRMGQGKALWIGKELSVAIKIEVNESLKIYRN